MYSSHPAKEKFTRTQRGAHSWQFEKKYTGMYSSHPTKENLLAHSEEHTAHNSKKYTGMYSSHLAKEKFTHT